MTLEQIKAARETMKDGRNRHFVATLANGVIMDGRSSIMMWDDANELLWVVYPNHEHRTNMVMPIEFECVSYLEVYTLRVTYDKDGGRKLLEKFAANGLTTMDSIKTLIDDVLDLSDLSTFTSIESTAKV